jgi:ethanolamine ammonia-lyase small subunit
MDSNDPWTWTLAAAMFAAQATHHTTLQASRQCNQCSDKMQSSMSNTHQTGNTSDNENNLESRRTTDARICLNALMTAPLETKCL